jgi:hypothetical protein
MMAAIRLVRSGLGEDAGLKKTQTEVPQRRASSLISRVALLCLCFFCFVLFCFVLFCFVLFRFVLFVLCLVQVRRLHGFDVSKEMVRKVVEEAPDSSDDDEAARAAALDAKRKKREEEAAAAAKLKLENLVNEGKQTRPFDSCN